MIVQPEEMLSMGLGLTRTAIQTFLDVLRYNLNSSRLDEGYKRQVSLGGLFSLKPPNRTYPPTRFAELSCTFKSIWHWIRCSMSVNVMTVRKSTLGHTYLASGCEGRTAGGIELSWTLLPVRLLGGGGNTYIPSSASVSPAGMG